MEYIISGFVYVGREVLEIVFLRFLKVGILKILSLIFFNFRNFNGLKFFNFKILSLKSENLQNF